MEHFSLRPGWTPVLLLLAAGLLTGCTESDAPDDVTQPVRAPEIARIVTAQEALAGAHVPTLDPATMNDAEIRKAIGAGPRCEFRYTRAGKPVLAVNMRPDGANDRGIVKLNGNLVPLDPAVMDANAKWPAGLLLTAGPIRMTVSPDGTEQGGIGGGVRHLEATTIFEVGDSLRVGYRGYLDCMPEPPPG